MPLMSVIAFLVVFISGLFPAVLFAENSQPQTETQVFSNKDLEKYKNPSDDKPRPHKAEKPSQKKDGLTKVVEEHEKEQWCKKATALRKKIERAKDEVEATKKTLAEETNTQGNPQKEKARDRKMKQHQKTIERSEKKLKYAEKDLSYLEEEAHRKRVPPGWLRCQFD